MANDNLTLAHLIASIGSLNGYGSSIAQTKRALDTGDTNFMRQDNEDVSLFEDIIDGIHAVKKEGFSVQGIIAINKMFKHSELEDPIMPGHLRNALYNTDNNIAIMVSEQTQEAYIPPEVVTKENLQSIIDRFNKSEKVTFDAWQVFASLAKLQPFQDGNKRTALIAANAARDGWEEENYLVLPFDELDKAEFSINLMRYYMATDSQAENVALKRMVALAPSQGELIYHHAQKIGHDVDLSKMKTKPLFKGEQHH